MVLVDTSKPTTTDAWLKNATDRKEAKAVENGKQQQLPTSASVFFDIAVDGHPLGRVVVQLDTEKAPMTCENFLALCTGSHKDTVDKRLHFKGSVFHRIVPHVYLCGGDVVNNNGTSGLSIYGETFADEKTGLKHDAPGVLSMLGHGPNTNSSQFFISLTPAPWMDEFYVAFGKVTVGLDLLDKISAEYGTESGVPTADNVRIVECGLLH